jgi:hypothetical protein
MAKKQELFNAVQPPASTPPPRQARAGEKSFLKNKKKHVCETPGAFLAKRCGSGSATSVSGVKTIRSPSSEWENLGPVNKHCSGSGDGSGSLDPYTGLRIRIRILLCSSVAFKKVIKNLFFSYYLL